MPQKAIKLCLICELYNSFLKLCNNLSDFTIELCANYGQIYNPIK